MTAQLSQQTIEALSNDADVRVRLDQQVVEVANAGLPPVRVDQFSIEIPNTLAPPSQLAQFVVEVLSSTTSVVFDPSVAFWGLEPGGEVTERWQWKTDVQIARSGAQVRSCLRSEPRVQVEFNVATTTPSEMSLIDFIITGWQSKSYYLPIWQDRARLTSTLTSGGTTISTPLAGLGYADGDLIALWTSLTEYRVIQVADADFETDIITLAQPIGSDWPIGTFIAPVRRAWLSPQASAALFTGASMEARLVFDLEEPVTLERIEWDRDEGGPWTADSFALFSHRPNWSQAPRVDYARRVDLLGDGTNRPWRYDVSGRSWITRSTLHTATNRAEINRLLSWVAQRRGRAISYMAPVWDTAIEVTRSNTDSEMKLYVKTRNFQQFFGAINGRGYIALRDASGWIVRRITSAAQESGTEDVLNLAAAIGRAGTPAGWLDAVLCEPSHLSSDVLEVRWWDRTTAEVIIGHQQVIA